MTGSNPLGRIKDITAGSLKIPFAVAGTALQVTRTVTGKAAGVVTSLIGHHGAPSSTPTPSEQPPAQEVAPVSPTATSAKSSPERAEHTEHPEPVNVTEELGLDPAPVEKPKPTKRKPAKKSATKIDAAADPDDVDATPADVAKVVAKDVPPDK